MSPAYPLLALDTSHSAASVAVGDGTRILAEVTLGGGARASASLMPAVDAAVRWAGLTPTDLQGVVVAGGPGSFTGLRIGGATTKGIVSTLGLPLWSYSSLLAAAAGCVVLERGKETSICALFDARRRDVYAACYRFRKKHGDGNDHLSVATPTRSLPTMECEEIEVRLEPCALSLHELLEHFRGHTPPIFTGDAALIYEQELERELGASVAPPHLVLPRASSLLWLQSSYPRHARVADPARWEPAYVRAPGAERMMAESKGAG